MPRPLILLIAFSLFTATVYGQEGKAPSPAVKRILDEAVRDIRVNRQAFDKANQKPLGEARKALDELSTKLIKDGKADEAAAVLRQVGTLEADVMRMANAPPPVAGGGAVPQKPLLERLQGKWRRGETIEVDIKGDSLQQSNGHKAQLTLLAPDIAEVRFTEGWKWHLHMIHDDLVVAVGSWAPNGERADGIVLDRIK